MISPLSVQRESSKKMIYVRDIWTRLSKWCIFCGTLSAVNGVLAVEILKPYGILGLMVACVSGILSFYFGYRAVILQKSSVGEFKDTVHINDLPLQFVLHDAEGNIKDQGTVKEPTFPK